VEKPSGRHRKPARGWAHRVRRLFGAVLTAVLCSPAGARREQHPWQPPRAGAPKDAGPAPRTRAAAAAEVDRPRPPSVPFAARGDRLLPAPVRIPPPRLPHPSEQGWCVDDDGVRGVRPYLFHGTSKVGPRPPEPPARAEPVELDELAALVRTWLSTAT